MGKGERKGENHHKAHNPEENKYRDPFDGNQFGVILGNGSYA